MITFRPRGPPYEWLAGSSSRYASTSTIVPPTPSTRNVQPISAGATSWTLRASSSPSFTRTSSPHRAPSVAALDPCRSRRRASRRRPSPCRRARRSTPAASPVAVSGSLSCSEVPFRVLDVLPGVDHVGEVDEPLTVARQSRRSSCPPRCPGRRAKPEPGGDRRRRRRRAVDLAAAPFRVPPMRSSPDRDAVPARVRARRPSASSGEDDPRTAERGPQARPSGRPR